MPNWCFGILKIRGNRENILKFLNEGIIMYRYNAKDRTNEKVDLPFVEFRDIYDPGDAEIIWKNPEDCWLHIDNTMRAFVETSIYWHASKILTIRDVTYAYIPIKQAWDFRLEDWKKISVQYNIDFRFQGVESGSCFTRDVEIEKGIVLKDEAMYHAYSEFIWERPFPEFGG